MRIVINTCYGGFGLSNKALKKYFSLQNKQIFIYKLLDDRDGYTYNRVSLHKFLCDKEKNFLSDIYVALEDFGDSINIQESKIDWPFISDYEIQRNDPYLVETVESLGEEANGWAARLKIIDIPDDVDWYIEDYDGMESVHERHRSWS